jgi:ribosomal protein L37E
MTSHSECPDCGSDCYVEGMCAECGYIDEIDGYEEYDYEDSPV